MTPLVSVFVTGYLTLSTIGPVFVWAENAVLGGIQWLLIFPLASAVNVAQGAAALAVALKSRDKKIKSLGLPSSLSAFMGITEPAISVGVHL